MGFPALRDTVTEVGKEISLQMSSKFGELGTSVYVRYDGAVQDCRMDADCWPGGGVDALSAPDACNASETCQPLKYAHYTAAAIPGNNFGSDEGFGGWGPGKKYPFIVDGVPLEAIIMKESTMSVKGDELRYLEVRANKIMRRLENCDGSGIGAKGIDCETPLSTAYQGHKLSGSPVFASLPMFSPDALQDTTGTNAGHGTSSYNPLTKITLTQCTGNTWCDEGRPDKFRALMKIEPESGKTFEGSLAAQINVRIQDDGISSTNISDATVPVYWYLVESKANADDMESLINLQAYEDFFNSLTMGLTIGGVVLIFCGTIGALVLCIRNKKANE